MNFLNSSKNWVKETQKNITNLSNMGDEKFCLEFMNKHS